MKNLNIFYFDNDLGPFDEFNPRFGTVLIKDFKEISEQVASSNILCLTHGVEKSQLFNELWHIYFY